MQLRAVQTEAVPLAQPVLQLVHCATEVFLHSCSQHSSSAAHCSLLVQRTPASTAASGSAGSGRPASGGRAPPSLPPSPGTPTWPASISKSSWTILARSKSTIWEQPDNPTCSSSQG